MQRAAPTWDPPWLCPLPVKPDVGFHPWCKQKRKDAAVLLQNELCAVDGDRTELSDAGGVLCRGPLVPISGWQSVPDPVSPSLPLSSLRSVLLQPSLGLNSHLSRNPLRDCNPLLGTIGREAHGLGCPSSAAASSPVPCWDISRRGEVTYAVLAAGASPVFWHRVPARFACQ